MFTRSLIGVWNEVIRYSLFQNPIDQEDFLRSGDSCNTDKQAKGNLHGEILEVVETGPANSKISFSAIRLFSGISMRSRPERKSPVREVFSDTISCRPPLGRDLTAIQTSNRSDIDNVIRRFDGFLIMFHHQHRVSSVTEFFSVSISLVVTLVQSDGGFIQYIQNSLQPCTNWEARRIRWASPPESVAAERLRLR